MYIMYNNNYYNLYYSECVHQLRDSAINLDISTLYGFSYSTVVI